VGRWPAAAWLLACGCDVVFRIDELPAPDAPPSCADASSHDEDGDGVPDGCDLCPGIPDPTQADADTDGVGDACDPDPSAAQRIAWFRSFAEPDVMTEWQIRSGAWAFDGESLVYAGANVGGYSMITTKTRPEPPYTVEVGLTIDELSTQGSVFEVFGDEDVPCGFIHYDAGPDVARADDIANTVNMESPLADKLHPAQRVRVTMDYAPSDQVVCAVTDRQTGATAVAHLLLDAVAVGHFGVEIELAAIHVEYIAIYAPK
jgi:hypothetical protein